jgi:hypothetical protein
MKMKTHRELFEKYSKGALDEAGVEDLNRLLVGAYFGSKGDLNQEELEYTEDLIFELYTINKLEEQYHKQFKNNISKDDSLRKKYSLFRIIEEASGSLKNEKQRLMLNSDVPEKEKKEEEQLEKILQEVIEKVHAEKEAPAAVNPWIENLTERLNSFFNSLIPQINFNQPQVKLAMVFASVVLLAVIVWVSVDPGKGLMTADNFNKDSLNINQIAKIDTTEIKKPDLNIQGQEAADLDNRKLMAYQDSVSRQKEFERKELGKQQRTEKLLLAYAEPVPRFKYVLTRSLTSTATDLFILAANKYNEKDYDSCILILSDLISKKSFNNRDTISKINFFLGNCYFAKGFQLNSENYLKKSLHSFKKIDSQTDYYIPAKRYQAFALMKMNKRSEAIPLLDSIIKANYGNIEQTKMIRDSLQDIIMD